MKKSIIFIFLGALTLLIVGIFASHANNKNLIYTGPLYSISNFSHRFAISPSCLSNLSSIIYTSNPGSGHIATLFGNTLFGYSHNSFVTLFN